MSKTRIALTGGIACGKSLVARYLNELGVETIDADDVVHEIIPDPAERKRIAAEVFADPKKRRALEARIHPLVRRRIEAFFEEPGAPRARVAIIPLLFETHWESDYDVICCVTSERETQISRMVATRGYTRAEAEARLAAQLPVAEKAARSHCVIGNDGTADELKSAVGRFVEGLERVRSRAHPRQHAEERHDRVHASAVVAVLALALAVGPAAAATKHYSFANGYPTSTSRQTTRSGSASLGAGASSGSSTRTVRVEEKTLVGRVVRVDAGDLVAVAPTGGRRATVRLRDIDAPERGQPYGVEAKKFLFDLVNGRDVTVHYFGKDGKGRILGTLMLQHEKGLVDVNLTLIRNGCAWYAESPRPAKVAAESTRTRAYAAGEKEARDALRGLWSAPNPVQPSEWRKVHK